MIQASFRPLVPWPHESTRGRRWHPFSAAWGDTLDLLDREIRQLRGSAVIIAAGFREDDIRLDGWPRAGTREPDHPGVEISFDSKHGRLVYATDVCAHWQDNVRSIAKGLESLRAVDRFGVSKRGQQYAGWRALPSGTGFSFSLEEARAILLGTFGGDDDEGWTPEEMYRRAAQVVHPDKGGSEDAFLRVRAAYELLRGAA